MLTLRLQYFTRWGENLYLRLPDRDLLMNCDSVGNWYVSLPVPIGSTLKYSYAVFEHGVETRREWRGHTLTVTADEQLVQDAWRDRPQAPFYAAAFTRIVGADKVDHWRGAGVAIPVFSLRSTKSFGIGEFADISLLADWAARTGMSVIQLLPINDTTMTRTWRDSYPYNANSSFALHPAYIRLEDVGMLSDTQKLQRFARLQAELNALPQVDYERVTEAKWEYLRFIYKETGRETFSTPSFRTFYVSNAYWLRPYAVYGYYRDKYGTPDFNRWPEVVYSEGLIDSHAPSLEALDGSLSASQTEAAFHYFVQYHLHTQLSNAVAYAHSRGIVLKGDIPIGISRYSVDAWACPQLFNQDEQAGAPPDAFAVDGQNWGFPTYNWEVMAQDGYAWFRNRFRKMSDYFDAYRIDHLLGFFRIWEIPVQYRSGLMGHFNPALPYAEDEIAARLDVSAADVQFLASPRDGDTDVLFVTDPVQKGCYHPRISGCDSSVFRKLSHWQQQAYSVLYDEYFYHRHNEFWRAEALKKLPALIDCTDMLACGEDLGMIPSCVPSVMEDLRILSLEVQRMPKAYGTLFGDPACYPYASVCTTSSHDTTNLRAWWEENPTLTQQYWHTVLHHEGPAPAHCEPWICEEIIRAHMQSPAMLAILPLQDWLGIDDALRAPDPFAERINVPANPHNYWHYRMHLTLEQLLSEKSFNDRIRTLTER